MNEKEKQGKVTNDICDSLNLKDVSKRDIFNIIWKLVAKELRIAPDQLNPDMTADEAGQMVFPPFVGLDILGELEYEVKMNYHLNIHFDDSKVPAFVTTGLFKSKNSESEKLKDWVLRITKLTNSLINEAKRKEKQD